MEPPDRGMGWIILRERGVGGNGALMEMDDPGVMRSVSPDRIVKDRKDEKP